MAPRCLCKPACRTVQEARGAPEEAALPLTASATCLWPTTPTGAGQSRAAQQQRHGPGFRPATPHVGASPSPALPASSAGNPTAPTPPTKSQGDGVRVAAPTPPAHPPPHPHTFHTGLIGGDGGALHSHTVLLGGQCGVYGDRVVGLVTVWEPQVEILELDIHVRQDELETDDQGKASAQMTVTQGHEGACAGAERPLWEGTTFSLMNCQMIRVISSPSISTTGFATLILLSASRTGQHGASYLWGRGGVLGELLSSPAGPALHPGERCQPGLGYPHSLPLGRTSSRAGPPAGGPGPPH